MELAKVTSKGQITIPADIRKKYGFQEGGKVVFLEDNDRVYIVNSTMLALKEAQSELKGLATELGLENEEDVVEMIKNFRKERQQKA